MWILPKNYHLSSHFAADMLESKEDLNLPGLNIEQSLMWRSSPSPLRTWYQRWKRVGWFQHLSGRILKPSQHKSLETKLMSSLPGIHVSHFRKPEKEREKTIQDIYGLSSENTSQQLDLFGVSSKMWKDTSAWDSEMCLKTWQDSVTQQCGDYSARLKLAYQRVIPKVFTKEKESLSWPTPTTDSATDRSSKYAQGGMPLALAVKFPTPSAHEARLGYQDRSDPTKKGTQESLTTVVVNQAGGRKQCTGHLNPTWVEWLMGVPIGWTELGSWGTELSPKQQQKRGAS